jgi:hypothetical protein
MCVCVCVCMCVCMCVCVCVVCVCVCVCPKSVMKDSEWAHTMPPDTVTIPAIFVCLRWKHLTDFHETLYETYAT